MSKLKDLVKNTKDIRKILAFAMIAELIIVGIAYLAKIDFLFKVENLTDVFSPIVFTLVMISYSYYLDNQFKGICCMAFAMLVNLIGYILNGYDIYDSFALCGFELPLSILGIIIMLTLSMYKDSKNKINVTLTERFKEPKHVKLLYRAMVYCTMFSIFVVVFNNNNLNGISNIELKTLMILQSVLPTFIMMGYITLTDVAYYIMILYNIVYGIITVLVSMYIGIEIMNIIYVIEFTLVIAYLATDYKSYIAKIKADKAK